MISSNFDDDELGMIYPNALIDDEDVDYIQSLVSADVMKEAKIKGIISEDTTKNEQDIFDGLFDEQSEDKPCETAPDVDIEEDEYDDIDEEPNNVLTTIAEAVSDNKPKILLLAIGVIGIVGISSFMSNKDKDSQPPVIQQREPKFDTVTQTVWGSTAGLDYSETISLSDTYYTDEIVVTKFAVFDDYSIQYYFSGIPKNFKQKITFPVTVQEYNSIPSGGKIFIDYKIVNKDGRDYVTDVSTSIKE